jgi:UDP-N-acetylmuramyl pentapeptide phosphotransferase/UDP-N-acetylglucosamine-1-phosphate transferase
MKRYLWCYFALLFSMPLLSLGLMGTASFGWEAVAIYLDLASDSNLDYYTIIFIASSLAIIGFLIGIALPYWLFGHWRQKLLNAQLLDHPNERSSHIQPVPRGAGWIFALILLAQGFWFGGAGFYFTYAFLRFFSLLNIRFPCCPNIVYKVGDAFYDFGSILPSITEPNITILLPTTGLLLLALVSWRDDCGKVAVRWRLAAQFFATMFVIVPLCWPALHEIYFPIAILGIMVIAISYVAFINFYNFMDGIDGITAIETLSLSLGILIIFVLPETRDHMLKLIFIPLILLGTSLAFLPHNLYPAKIFLGDVGSVTIGYIVGFCLLSMAAMGYWYVTITLPLYYLADGVITLLRRMMRGERFWEAHRTHFYQRAALAAGRHDVVVKKIALCNAVLIMIAVLAVSLHNPWLCLLAPLPVAVLLSMLSKQKPCH